MDISVDWRVSEPVEDDVDCDVSGKEDLGTNEEAERGVDNAEVSRGTNDDAGWIFNEGKENRGINKDAGRGVDDVKGNWDANDDVDWKFNECKEDREVKKEAGRGVVDVKDNWGAIDDAGWKFYEGKRGINEDADRTVDDEDRKIDDEGCIVDDEDCIADYKVGWEVSDATGREFKGNEEFDCTVDVDRGESKSLHTTKAPWYLKAFISHGVSISTFTKRDPRSTL